MDEKPTPEPMPKKSCMITLMFACPTDQQAIDVKGKIDEIVKDIAPKRYSFSINET